MPSKEFQPDNQELPRLSPEQRAIALRIKHRGVPRSTLTNIVEESVFLASDSASDITGQVIKVQEEPYTSNLKSDVLEEK